MGEEKEETKMEKTQQKDEEMEEEKEIHYGQERALSVKWRGKQVLRGQRRVLLTVKSSSPIMIKTLWWRGKNTALRHSCNISCEI